MKTAAVYIRVSTDDQTEHSPDSQLREIKSYAKRHKMLIDPAHIYTDAGISGRNAKKRPQFQKMISVAKTKPSPFDTILVWKFSRFARNQEESILYKSLLHRECQVDVVSITEETGDSMFGPLIERIIEWMDEFYSVRLSEEVRAKMTFVAEKGRVQAVAPFGYRKPKEEPLSIVEEEAVWVRYIFKHFLEGDSMLSIAKNLNAAGIRTHRGNKFENRTIEYMLYNPMYVGYVRWTPTGKTLSKRIYDSPDTLAVKNDDIPKIISEEIFEKAQEELAKRKATRRKYGKPVDVQKHWLSGLVRCSNCGGTLSYSPASGGFQCHRYSKGTCNKSHYIKAEKLEKAVVDSLRSIVVTDQFIKECTVAPNDSVVQDYHKTVQRLEAMLDRAKLAFVEGIDTLEEYSDNKKRIQSEIDQIAKLIEEEKESRNYIPKKEVEQRLVDIISLITQKTDQKAKHLAISSIVETIEFSRDSETVKIFYKL